MTNDVVLGADCRALRHRLAPLDWMVLEELALDAVDDDAGRLCSITSARQMAECLGCDPGAVAKALARLRHIGLAEHHRQAESSGRFGRSVYRLGAIAGLRVATDQSGPALARSHTARTPAVSPRTVPPRMASPGTVSPGTVSPHMETDAVQPAPRRQGRASSSSAAGGSAAPAGGGQLGLFDATGATAKTSATAQLCTSTDRRLLASATGPTTSDSHLAPSRPRATRVVGPSQTA